MSQTEIIRAWKDAGYRNSLSAAELALLPANPAGLIELPETSLRGYFNPSIGCTTAMTCGCPLTYRCPTFNSICS